MYEIFNQILISTGLKNMKYQTFYPAGQKAFTNSIDLQCRLSTYVVPFAIETSPPFSFCPTTPSPLQ